MFFKIIIIFPFFISFLYSSVNADDSNYENLGLCISKVALKSKYESIQKMTFLELKDYRKRFEKGKEEGI